MNILLTQTDIENAVKQYVENQGISLRNKTLVSVFAMGRGGNGLSATVKIEDISIPGDEGTTAAPEDTALAVAAPSAVVIAEVAPIVVVEETIAPTAPEAEAVAPVAEEAAAVEVEVAPAAKSTTSLFGTP